jgi:TPP-dependent pyruvate/acetoin dehydrogenase alpha subunit
MTIPKEKLLWMYQTMVRHREFENAVQREFEMKNIPGFVHLGQGQEAIGAGALAAIRPDDYFTSNHRGGHGHLIARGESTNRMMAEMFGKETGVMKGKGGCMHFGNVQLGDLGNDGILGTAVVIASGVALSFKIKGTDQVALSFFGDSVINTGAFHEGVNLASTWKLPVIFIMENNRYSMSTFIYDTTNLTRITDRALAYNIPGITVDGNDVIAVHEVVAEAVSRARRGEGPAFIEAQTCRQRGHFEGDTVTYRRPEELEECRKRDPIPRLKKRLIQMGILTEEKANSIYQEALQEMEEAVKFAKESQYPDTEEIFTDVYA